MEATLNEIKSQVTTLEREMNSLNSGNQSAGARARKACMLAKTGCHTLRKEVTNHLKKLKLEKAPTVALTAAPTEVPTEVPVVVRKPAPKKKSA